MARTINDRDLTPILLAAREWIRRCLIEDGSILGEKTLWTQPQLEAVRAAFVDHPDAGTDDFITKLRGQMATAMASEKQLMAEMMWVLLLFPSNIGVETKRKHVVEIWSWSGEQCSLQNPMLAQQVIQGVGSAGTAYNNLRWKELAYLMALCLSLKAKPADERRSIFESYDSFIDWIDSVPRDGNRQFRHMIRYFAFPERVERMSSNNDRISILVALGVGQPTALKDWPDRDLDTALLNIRKAQEVKHPGVILDFYEPPLSAMWGAVAPAGAAIHQPNVQNPQTAYIASAPAVAQTIQQDDPINLILYGPPGTGKTHWLRQKFSEYTDKPDEVDVDTWLQETLSGVGWRSVIVATLAHLGRPARVPEIRDHPWIQAKAKQRGRALKSVQATLWGYLQEHTPETNSEVKVSIRRPPYVFSKREVGDWHLQPDWSEIDDESAELLRVLTEGPQASKEAVRRYRVVTFHPSFTYEDFVRGIRPVVTTEDGATQFRLVDGKFKQICDEAHANPAKRYALFIDEINRANIAKVFGELITLIEPDKRAVFDAQGVLVGGMAVQLPGGDETDSAERAFGVPRNLDIYGTMNTADRSIALLDTALRRRFRFEERGPDYSTLTLQVDGVEVNRLLERINDRIEYLLDRDHRIGHAYLMRASSLADLREVFATQIIPLLQEFFFDDFSRVALVLSTSGSQPFLAEESLQVGQLFPGRRLDGMIGDRSRYRITQPSTWTADSFSGVYEATSTNA